MKTNEQSLRIEPKIKIKEEFKNIDVGKENVSSFNHSLNGLFEIETNIPGPLYLIRDGNMLTVSKGNLKIYQSERHFVDENPPKCNMDVSAKILADQLKQNFGKNKEIESGTKRKCAKDKSKVPIKKKKFDEKITIGKLIWQFDRLNCNDCGALFCKKSHLQGKS